LALRILSIDSRGQAERILRNLGADPAGVACMSPKMRHLNIKVPRLECRMANIIKQDMLSVGGDAAVARGTVDCSIPHTDVILMGTEKQLQQAVCKLKGQPFGLKQLSQDLKEALSSINRYNFDIKYNSGVLRLADKTHIMGVLNVTPDSFSDGGAYLDPALALERAMTMADEGADIIDIGGESTRPGAKEVSSEEELRRIIPVIEAVAKKVDVPVSVDTYKAKVAKRALESGASIINDISGLRFDPEMADVAASMDCPIIMMHIRGTPADMQLNPVYASLMDEVIDYLKWSIAIAQKAGVDPDKIIVDPGVGFGKSFNDNLYLIKHLDELKVLGKPILVGTSRKSFIGGIIAADPDDRLEGTLATSLFAQTKGANIIRVHDVKEAKRAADVTDTILRCN